MRQILAQRFYKTNSSRRSAYLPWTAKYLREVIRAQQNGAICVASVAAAPAVGYKLLTKPSKHSTPSSTAVAMLYQDAKNRIAAAVKTRRESLNWSQEYAAARCGISKRDFQRIEAGEGNPSLLVLMELSAGLKLSLGTLIGPDVSALPDPEPRPKKS